MSPREKCLPTGAPNSNFKLRVSCETEMRKHHQLSFTTNITELIKPNELTFVKMHDAHEYQITKKLEFPDLKLNEHAQKGF